MRVHALWLAIATVIAANGLGLYGVWENRSGAPDADIEMTSRELRFYGSIEEDGSAQLSMEWNSPDKLFDAPRISELKLQPAGEAKPVWVAIEYGGTSWQKWSQGVERLEGIGEQSRLIAFDAGLDPAVLRERHPDGRRVLIVRGTAVAREDGFGRIIGIAHPRLYVPAGIAPNLVVPQPGKGPRYVVRVRSGKKFVPWIADVQPGAKE